MIFRILAFILMGFMLSSCNFNTNYQEFIYPSGSMENTIMAGSTITVDTVAYKDSNPERYDIILFQYPDDQEILYAKRIMGLPGETVNIVDSKVYIDDNEEPLDDSFIKEITLGDFGSFIVPDGHYFVLGDNRNSSSDSRFWLNPYVDKNKILGKVLHN